MKKFILSLLICLPIFLFAQEKAESVPVIGMEEKDKTATIFASTIKADEMKRHLTYLASDELEGRETGTAGQRKAADYIAAEFKKLGLPTVVNGNSYFQEIAFSGERWEEIEVNVGKKRFRNLWNFYAFPYTNADSLTINEKEVIFLGYGIDDSKYSDYAGVNVKGKTVFVYQGEPTNAEGISYLTGTSTPSDWATDWRKKLEVAKANGVKTILFIDAKIQKSISKHRQVLLSPRLQIQETAPEGVDFPNNIFVSTDVIKAITGRKNKKFIAARDAITKTGKPHNQKFKTKFKLNYKKWKRQILGSNVLGFIEGTDPKLKDEVVVVTAHYDHLGMKGESIFYGADDNASGSSTVLEIAQAFVEAKKSGVGPRRSVLCMLVSGEEKGLLGSQYYATFPVFPLANTVANVNVDMVGRIDSKHEKANNPNYIYVIGSDRLSTELHDINENMNKEYTNIELDYTYNDPKDPNRFYERSDHYNFAEKGIPAIFYFSGTHVDYHRPSDTVDKINFEKMEIIGKLIFHTSWQLANQDKRIEVNVGN
ncbi:MAG: hypothetical protein ACI9XO_002383 [Paraglaciecola sp.]|jgi:hypothetical protein